MTRGFVLFLTVLMVLAARPVQAGKFNNVLNLGDPAPAWTELPGVDGKKHSLADLKDKQIVVVVFTCNSCPIASDYEDRTIAFAKSFAGPDKPTAVVAINVNTVEEDRLPKMKERAESKRFLTPTCSTRRRKSRRPTALSSRRNSSCSTRTARSPTWALSMTTSNLRRLNGRSSSRPLKPGSRESSHSPAKPSPTVV